MSPQFLLLAGSPEGDYRSITLDNDAVGKETLNEAALTLLSAAVTFLPSNVTADWHARNIVVGAVAALWLSRVLERKLLPHDPEAGEQLRRRFHVWYFRAAAIAFIVAVALVIHMHTAIGHG